MLKIVSCALLMLFLGHSPVRAQFTWSHGGIIRGDTGRKEIALIFSADEFTDGIGFIDRSLKKQSVEASFFFTGRMLSKPENHTQVKELLRHGNYIGSHSFGHLLYCDWAKRDSLLVSKKEFVDDLEKSYGALKRYGISKQSARYFLPPYEWYNDSISYWAKDAGLQVINFTPGTYSNADYTTPDMGSKYLSSDTIYARILRYEEQSQSGLNGFLLLLHAGTDTGRIDKMYFKLPSLLRELKSRGYRFVRVDELLL